MGRAEPVTNHAFIYDVVTGVMTDLGTLPGGARSGAVAVNFSSPTNGTIGGFFGLGFIAVVDDD